MIAIKRSKLLSLVENSNFLGLETRSSKLFGIGLAGMTTKMRRSSSIVIIMNMATSNICFVVYRDDWIQ